MSSLELGPIIGAADSAAKVWIKGAVQASYTVVCTPSNAKSVRSTFVTGDDGIGVAHLSNLTPNTDYRYDLVDEQGESIYTGGRFATLPDPGAHVDFSFAFFSCHKPAADTAMVMWDRLSGICHGASRVGDSRSLRFALAIGDQIYADELDTNPKAYLGLDEAGLAFHFDSRYSHFWRYRSVQDVFSRCPMFMMWDDHEIRDGWGSRKGDLSSPQLRNVFSAAAHAFVRHQLLHNPHCPRPTDAKYYAFRFAQAGLIVTDLRGERDVRSGQIMSPTQWQWLTDTLYRFSSECKIVFVIVGVPFFHPVRGLALAMTKLLNVVSKDEMEDSWGSKSWQAEGKRLAKLLFDVAGAPGLRAKLYLLSGDAHIATGAEIRLGTDLQALTIPQFTSSAISNAAPEVLKKVRGNIQKDAWQRIYKTAPYEGRMPHLIAARNFGVIRVEKRPDASWNVRFELQHEKSDTHVTLYDNGTLGSPIIIT